MADYPPGVDPEEWAEVDMSEPTGKREVITYFGADLMIPRQFIRREPKPRCTAALNIRGEAFVCDHHLGHLMAHSSRTAGAIWASPTELRA